MDPADFDEIMAVVRVSNEWECPPADVAVLLGVDLDRVAAAVCDDLLMEQGPFIRKADEPA